ncbi:MAG TPA: GEVED domain-containing protein, partial [Flavobacteriales bacterium]|nr:GEVED domain-containing protein [Flavobacteriales bacterium]
TGCATGPANDNCANVTTTGLPVPGNITFTGDNTDAIPGDDGLLNLGGDTTTVWHRFSTTVCANVTISYCNTATVPSIYWSALFLACPADANYVLPSAFDFTTCGNGAFTMTFGNLAPGTYYLPVRGEPATAGPYSISVVATACSAPSNYCDAGAVSLQFEKISNVTFSDINNNSSSNAGYEDFISVVGSVVGGVSYPISVTIAAGYATDQVLAWVDWDHNSVFDAGEIVFSSAPGIGPHTGNVTVPLTAIAGPTTMRVRLHDTYVGTDYQNTPNATPCDTSTFGQVEDYTVDLVGIITGVASNANSTWSVLPNPSNGDFTVRYAGQDGQAKFEVVDMTGRVVYAHQRAVSKGANINLGLAGQLAAGTYMLRVTNGASVEEQRIVVQ